MDQFQQWQSFAQRTSASITIRPNSSFTSPARLGADWPVSAQLESLNSVVIV